MLDTIRHLDFFDPMEVKDSVHVIGVGAVGSHVANALARLGIENIHIWDFDNVESHNIPNQMFTQKDLNDLKINAIEKQLKEINPEINIFKHNKYEKNELEGFIFACVDSIEVRKEIYEINEYNPLVKAVFDTRIALAEGQVFSADWSSTEDIAMLLEQCNFTHDEVEIPVSACGTKLAVLPTVQFTATSAVSNFINFIKEGTLKRMIMFNAFNLKMVSK